jgi:hypothetical protein
MRDKSDGGKPVTWTFAGLVLVALGVLVLLRHAFGVIRVEAGTR